VVKIQLCEGTSAVDLTTYLTNGSVGSYNNAWEQLRDDEKINCYENIGFDGRLIFRGRYCTRDQTDSFGAPYMLPQDRRRVECGLKSAGRDNEVRKVYGLRITKR